MTFGEIRSKWENKNPRDWERENVEGIFLAMFKQERDYVNHSKIVSHCVMNTAVLVGEESYVQDRQKK